MSWYCNVAPGHAVHGPYHDEEYGFPVADDRVLFERLCLEIFQAGLSWELILKRRPGLNAAFERFDFERIANYGERETARLLTDPRIIRNRRKVAAVVENARRLQAVRAEHDSFTTWIAAHHPRRLPEWVRLFRQTFVFMGAEVVNEFLMSIGYLPGSHAESCPVYDRLLALEPPWLTAQRQGFDFSGG